MRSTDTHLRAISLEISQPSVTNISLKITNIKIYKITISVVPVSIKQPWRIWLKVSHEFKRFDTTTTKQNTAKLYAYFMGCAVSDVTNLPVLGFYCHLWSNEVVIVFQHPSSRHSDTSTSEYAEGNNYEKFMHWKINTPLEGYSLHKWSFKKMAHNSLYKDGKKQVCLTAILHQRL